MSDQSLTTFISQASMGNLMDISVSLIALVFKKIWLLFEFVKMSEFYQGIIFVSRTINS